MNYPTKQNNFEGHRIWHFIEQAKFKGQDSINFYHPISVMANKRYSEMSEHLNKLGYLASGISNPEGMSLTGIMRISNILKVS